MKDLIERQAAIEVILTDKIDNKSLKIIDALGSGNEAKTLNMACDRHAKLLKSLPSAQPEIIRCKDCKFYSPMNRETKTGICNLIMHQNFGDDWFCAGAERRKHEENTDFICKDF